MQFQSRLDTYFNTDTHRTVIRFLVFGQYNEKQNYFKNEMCVRGSVVSTGQLNKALA